MKTTEPTTPQPKPADAAGLRWHNPDNLPSAGEPPWRFLTTEELTNALPEDAQWCRPHEGADEWRPVPTYAKPFPENTYRIKRPLPTPHAAEVRAGDVVEEIRQLFVGRHTAAALLIWEYREHIAAILARHRTAAETVGADVFFVAAASGLLYRDPKAAGDVAHVLVNGKPYYPTPPATQSALEQAREALAWLGTEDRDIVNYSRISPCKASHDCKIADGSTIKAGTIFWRIAFGPKDPSNRFATLTAALNAVLPPAKGGDGV